MKTVWDDTFLSTRDTREGILHVERVFVRITTIDGVASQRRVVVPLGTIQRVLIGGSTRFFLDNNGESFATWRDAARELEDRVRTAAPDWDTEES